MIQYVIDAPIHLIFTALEDVENFEKDLQEVKEKAGKGELQFPVNLTFRSHLLPRAEEAQLTDAKEGAGNAGVA